jgi:hypothetical protein
MKKVDSEVDTEVESKGLIFKALEERDEAIKNLKELDRITKEEISIKNGIIDNLKGESENFKKICDEVNRNSFEIQGKHMDLQIKAKELKKNYLELQEKHANSILNLARIENAREKTSSTLARKNRECVNIETINSNLTKELSEVRFYSIKTGNTAKVWAFVAIVSIIANIINIAALIF